MIKSKFCYTSSRDAYDIDDKPVSWTLPGLTADTKNYPTLPNKPEEKQITLRASNIRCGALLGFTMFIFSALIVAVVLLVLTILRVDDVESRSMIPGEPATCSS